MRGGRGIRRPGFDAAGVDRIAARARVNKAMIYYHFGSKRALYIEVLRDMFRAVGARARAIADGPGTASEKLETWIDTIIEEAARASVVPAHHAARTGLRARRGSTPRRSR